MRKRMVLTAGVIIGVCTAQAQAAYTAGTTQSIETTQSTGTAQNGRGTPAANTWTGGGGFGFLTDTPDDSAFAVNLFADKFLSSAFSLGPLLQMAFTGNLAQYGFSGQAKYWMPLSGIDDRTRLVWQAGVGFIHADFMNHDTSWLVPIGLGIDHTLVSGQSLYAALLVNFTDLHTGGGTKADVMPGMSFGIRF